MMYKMAAVGKLVPGDIKNPVAIRRVHSKNRITNHLLNKRKSYSTNNELFGSLLHWGEKNLKRDYQNLIALRYVERLRKSDYFDDPKVADYFISRTKMFRLAYKYPKLLINHWFWRMVIPSKTVFI